MSGYNHIVGGTVFTGIFLSMYDVNIFSQPIYLFFTAFFAVIADVDHVKSPVGKMFYPLARYLDKKYGHRTITHSLLCYIILFIMISLIEKSLSQKSIIAGIFLWSFGSHLVFDMVTKQGVPLFYPFIKNPCVIPANPQYRFKSSEMKTEAMIFVFFIFLGLTCKNLFAFGFWNTFNKTFNNIKHIADEQRIYDGIISIKYEIKKNGIAKKGNGIAIEATDKNVILFDKEFVEINEKDRIITLLPERLKKHLIKKELQFVNISGDSLRKIIKNKMIIKLKGEAQIPINYNKESLPITSTTLDLDYVYNPVFQTNNIDTIDVQIEQQINILNEQIENNNINQNNLNMQKNEKTKEKNEAFARLEQLKKDINNEDLYVKEQAIKELSNAQNNYNQLTQNQIYTTQNNSQLIRLNYLKSKLHIKKRNIITGFIIYAEEIN